MDFQWTHNTETACKQSKLWGAWWNICINWYLSFSSIQLLTNVAIHISHFIEQW